MSSSSSFYKPVVCFSLGYRFYSKLFDLPPYRIIPGIIHMVELPSKVLNKGNQLVNGNTESTLNILHQSSLALSMWQSKPSEATPLGCEISIFAVPSPHNSSRELVNGLIFSSHPRLYDCPLRLRGRRPCTHLLWRQQWTATLPSSESVARQGSKISNEVTAQAEKKCSSRRRDFTQRLKTETISCHCRHPALTLIVKVCDWVPEK